MCSMLMYDQVGCSGVGFECGIGSGVTGYSISSKNMIMMLMRKRMKCEVRIK